MSLQRSEWRNYWEKTNDVGHAINNDDWHKKYAQEISMFIGENKDLIGVDTGCGSCEVLRYVAPNFKKIIGLDYSKRMIEKSKSVIFDQKINNVDVYYSDMLDIKKVIHEEVDFIYNNQVAQYLNEKELYNFIQDSLSLLKENGSLFLFNVPNKLNLFYFGIGVYKQIEQFSFSSFLVSILKFKWGIFKEKIKNRNYEFDGDCGNWYTPDEIKLIIKDLNVKIEFFSPIYFHHDYRFHVKISKM